MHKLSDKDKLLALTLGAGGAYIVLCIVLYIYILGPKTFYVIGFLAACYIVTKLLSMLQDETKE